MTDFGELLLLTIFGRILLYVWMEYPLPEWVERNKYIRGWHECDLCGGVPLFSILFLICGFNIFKLVGIVISTGLVGTLISSLLGGAIISFVCHIFRIGYQTKFSRDVIE